MSSDRHTPAELRDYLKDSVNPIIEPLIVELLKHRPTDVPEFIIKHMQKIQSNQQSAQESDSKKKADDKAKIEVSPATEESSEEEDDEDDEQDDALFELEKAKLLKKNPRASVSAEAYGSFNRKENFEARVIPKNPEQKKRIIERLSRAFMFAGLEDKEKEIVVNAMEEKQIKADTWIIRQGDDGNELYVIDEGKLECFKQFNKNEEAKMVKTYNPGESFGELALLYNAPRAASIKAVTDSVLYALDRATFNNIVKDAEIKRRERFEHILSKVEILESMDPYERTKIADAAGTVKYKAGEYIIKQGDAGDKFYFIEDGTAEATKLLKGKDQPEIVYSYKEGDYFGELALLKDEPRAANVVATSDITLLALDRDAFTRVLGPLQDILKRNTTKYEKYM